MRCIIRYLSGTYRHHPSPEVSPPVANPCDRPRQTARWCHCSAEVFVHTKLLEEPTHPMSWAIAPRQRTNHQRVAAARQLAAHFTDVNTNEDACRLQSMIMWGDVCAWGLTFCAHHDLYPQCNPKCTLAGYATPDTVLLAKISLTPFLLRVEFGIATTERSEPLDAVKDGDMERVEALLDQGMAVDARDEKVDSFNVQWSSSHHFLYELNSMDAPVPATCIQSITSTGSFVRDPLANVSCEDAPPVCAAHQISHSKTPRHADTLPSSLF